MNIKECIFREMCISDIEECIAMTLENFGTDQYSSEQFLNIEVEFNQMFETKDWSRPTYIVCEFKGKIIGMGGFALSWLDWDTFEFFWFSVKKEFRGYGIGKAIVEYREKEVIKRSSFKKDITILFSCTKFVSEYHKKNGYKILFEKASGNEVIMGKTFLKK